ncbi:phosphotransferase [Bauldia sp.]|uniref:phosphotransferase n=1 Tax=Bauldia sp. TaxID=2575872 RepID=UPI003BAC14B4
MSSDIPSTIEAITPEWLNTIVFPHHTDNRIVAVKSTQIGEGRGFLSQTFVVHLTFENPERDNRPSSIVVKMQPKDGWNVAAEAELSAFEREVSFYRDIAPDLPIRLPKVFFAEASERGHILVIENLSHHKGGDQVRGMPHEQVLATARQIANLHAAFWDNDAVHALEWAPKHDYFHVHTYVDQWPRFAEEFSLRLGPDAMRIGETIAGNIDRLEARIAERPLALVHGDLRADNLMVRPDEPTDVVIIDWQLTGRNLATLDIARLMGGSEPPAERSGHQLEVVETWHGALSDAGVSAYNFEDARHDFRLAALHCLVIPVKMHNLNGDNPSGRAGRLLDAMAQRFFAAALEVEAEQALA